MSAARYLEDGYLTQVQRGIDYIESHLDESFALAKVSKVAGISHWHFQRIFKALTGETLMTYVRSRRLARSLDRLLKSNVGILQIAMDAGFESQAAFTRAFKSAFGLTPGAYRKIGDKSLFLQKARIDADYLMHVHENVSRDPVITERPAMRLCGLRTKIYGVDSDRNNIAERLPPLWNEFLARLPALADARRDADDAVCYGVIQPQSAESEQLIYHAAVVIPANAPLTNGFVELQIPAARYATFTHKGASNMLDHTVNYIYSAWLARSGERHSYGADLELYDHRFDDTSEDSVMEYAIPLETLESA